jgi:GNAT superfamily N-acetyltransferase
MNATVSIRFVERFPEPAFAELQRKVFAPLECLSPEFAAAVRAERSASGSSLDPALFPPMVRFGAFLDEQLVGWSIGWFERPDTFFMANSAVLSSHRRLGVYSQLVCAIVEYAQLHGATTVHSRHSVLNTPVIMAKLKLGFIIAGTHVSAQVGLQVQLVRHVSTPRADVFHDRVVPFVRPHDA